VEVERAAYKDLLVWQKGMEFANQVIQLIDSLDTPRKHYRLLEQLESAVTSVPMNIFELLFSCFELRSWCYHFPL
jgi:hypothetical protein